MHIPIKGILAKKSLGAMGLTSLVIADPFSEHPPSVARHRIHHLRFFAPVAEES
jgi:hypothetical protein